MMQEAGKILAFALFFILLLFLQISGVVKVWGIVPNFILLLSILTALASLRIGLWVGLLIFEAFLVWVLVPFWFNIFFFFGALSIAVRLVRTRLTGNRLLDFLLVIAVATGLWYGVFTFRFFSWGIAGFAAKEIALNCGVGVCLWLVLRAFVPPYEKITS